MQLKILGILFVISVLAIVTVSASMMLPTDDNAKEHARAPEHSPVINDDWGLERIDFIHYVWGTKPARVSAEKCYKLLGVKWKNTPVDYTINPINSDNLPTDFVTSTISTSAETWDAVTSTELFNNDYLVDYNAYYGVQNFINAISFGDYPDDNVIAVTSVWYTPVGRQIVEFDMLFNTRFMWGDALLNSGVMDLQNIATHELGHGVGLADIYSTACSQVTMFGYSSYGETSKRSLEQPDITGLVKMYGA